MHVRMYARLDLSNLTYNVLTGIAVQLITAVNLDHDDLCVNIFKITAMYRDN